MTKKEIEHRIEYLEQALTPGTLINTMTTFYVGKGDDMRKELAELKAKKSQLDG